MAANAKTMRAWMLDKPGNPSDFYIKEIPIPKPEKGWVLIKVKAFGLNRSEHHTLKGLASGVNFPRVLGIEASGTVEAAPGGEFKEGQQVCAMMGGMGRVIDGGYAEYTCVPASNVIPFTSPLPWSQLGGVGEMLQTTYGSLSIGLDAKAGQSILIRGGTSSIGMATAVLAKQMGLTVFSTTRTEKKGEALKKVGVDHILIDDGKVAEQVRKIKPEGVECALELIGTDALPDTLRACGVKGTTCFTGMLSNHWTVKEFYPIEYLPRGVRLAAYGGGADDLPQHVLQEYMDAVEKGKAIVPIDTVFKFEDLPKAHERMDSGKAAGKMVVMTGM